MSNGSCTALVASSGNLGSCPFLPASGEHFSANLNLKRICGYHYQHHSSILYCNLNAYICIMCHRHDTYAWLSINHNHCPECTRCPEWRHTTSPNGQPQLPIEPHLPLITASQLTPLFLSYFSFRIIYLAHFNDY